jgi:hypothetical protein
MPLSETYSMACRNEDMNNDIIVGLLIDTIDGLTTVPGLGNTF